MRISVVIPYFNRTGLLRRSIGSVLAQSAPPHEVIAVDDRSPEDTDWLEREFPCVRVVRLEQNGGPGWARYQGARAATGTHIATLDMDDYWFPEKLERQTAFALEIGDARGIYSHQQLVEEGEGPIVRPPLAPVPGETIAEYLFVRNGLLQSNTFLIERELYLELAQAREGLYPDDWELMLAADALGCRVHMLMEPLAYWHCVSDAARGSHGYDLAWFEAFLERQSGQLNERARSALCGRVLAPRLARSGHYARAARLLGEAIMAGALSPVAASKIVGITMFPESYRRSAAAVDRLRGALRRDGP